MKYIEVIALSCLFLLSGCEEFRHHESNRSFNEKQIEQLEAVVDGVMADQKLVGGVIGVWVSGEAEWTTAKGIADKTTGRKVTLGDKFRIASITKTFTATMVLILVDQKKIVLDAPLSVYLPEIQFADKITARQLLNHTSGIVDNDDAVDDVVAKDPLKHWTPMEVVQAYTGGKLVHKPGEQFHYSNTGYVILGMLIEKASGQRVGSFFDNHIREPLGLTDTYFPTGPDIAGVYAHGYDGNDDISRIDMSWDWTAGAMISTLKDLRVWGKAFGSGELLSKEQYDAQQSYVDIPGTGGNTKYGLGMRKVMGLLGHSGANPGYQSELEYFPDKDAVIVILYNKLSSDCSDLPASGMTLVGILKTLFPELLK